MSVSPLAGKPAPKELIIDISALESAYFDRTIDVEDPSQKVSFGTSGHRGTPLEGSFNQAHILAISQAICDYRSSQGIDGPLFLGKDTHALSNPAQETALEVLAANGIEVFIERDDRPTPTPVISRAILAHNRETSGAKADGIVITPSHNPPSDGGFKYNAVDGGPAETGVTKWIEQRANELLHAGNRGVKRVLLAEAMLATNVQEQDLVLPYVADLANVLDMEAIASSGLTIGVDPLGGAAAHYWGPISEQYGIDIEVVNSVIDPTFSFMPVDHDGKIRMDCSSAYAMANLLDMKDSFQLAIANDPDADRFGIVTPSVGLLNPNHYLAVAIKYLLQHRTQWPETIAVGKTLVSSAMIDRVVASTSHPLTEVPVGFKWFTPGLFAGSLCFGGEESAGASFLRKDGTVWTTDKDGLLLNLLAAEITAVTGKDPSEQYAELTAAFGEPNYRRIDAAATAEQKQKLQKVSPDAVQATSLAGEPIIEKLSHAPGNGAAIGGLKVRTENAWFAARPSGTEAVYKIYAESFKGSEHLEEVIAEAQEVVDQALLTT